MRKINAKGVLSGVAVLLIALIVMTGCDPAVDNTAGGTGTLSVSWEDNTEAKLIGPQNEAGVNNVDVSHYRITVSNSNGSSETSDYLPKGDKQFTIKGLVEGNWNVKVEAYVETTTADNANTIPASDTGTYNLVKVAEGNSDTTVKANEANSVTVTINTLDVVDSGAVTVTLKMPKNLSANGTAFKYYYRVLKLSDNSEVSVTGSGSDAAMLDGQIDNDNGTFNLTLGTIDQGSYLLFVTVADSAGANQATAMDAMRLLNGLTASGELDFNSSVENPSLDLGLTIEDLIGDIITFQEIAAGEGTTIFNVSNTADSFNVDLPASLTYKWFLDGVAHDDHVAEAGTQNAAEGMKTWTVSELQGISNGRHIVTVVGYDSTKKIEIGSINLTVNKVGISFEN